MNQNEYKLLIEEMLQVEMGADPIFGEGAAGVRAGLFGGGVVNFFS